MEFTLVFSCPFLVSDVIYLLVLMNACCYPSEIQWLSHSLVPARSVLGHGWQWVAVSSPRSLQPSCPCQNSVSVWGCQLSKAWTSCLSSPPGWERSNANICALVVWLGAAEKLLGTPKTFKSFVFAIPKQVQNSPPPSTILWYFDCRHHQIEFGWVFYRAAWAVLCYPVIHVSCIILSFCECQQTECICLKYRLRFMVLCIRDCSPCTSAE